MEQKVDGRVRRCDVTCQTAKLPQCDCICGGRYHGRGTRDAEVQRAARVFADNQHGWTMRMPDGATVRGRGELHEGAVIAREGVLVEGGTDA